MATQYDTWLATLGGLRADMPMTVRGLAISHTVTYPGNVTTATLEGTVKAAPDATAELATFTVGTPAFADGVTTWAISLNGTATSALPADSDGDGREDFIFDMLLTLSGGSPERIFAGLFPVSGFVTEPA
jgi:hypothetical protein